MKDAVPALFRLPVVSGYRYSAGAPLIQTVTGTGAYAKSMTRAFSGSGYSGDDPLALPLAQNLADIGIAFAGKFDLNTQPTWPYLSLDMEATGLSVSQDGNHIYFQNHAIQFPGAQVVSKYTLPAIGGTAQPLVDATVEPITLTGMGETGVAGTVEYNGNLYIATKSFYDNGEKMTDGKWMTRLNANLKNQIPLAVGSPDITSYARLLTGQLIELPDIWKTVFGKPCASLPGCGQSIVGAENNGHGFILFDPEAVPTDGGTFPVECLSWRQLGVRLTISANNPDSDVMREGQYGKEWGETWGWGSTGTAWIPPGTRTIVYLTGIGRGPNVGTRTCGGSVSNEPSVVRLFFYDLADFKAVQNGTMEPWEPEPYYYGDLPNALVAEPDGMGGHTNCVYVRAGSFAYDYTRNRLYGTSKLFSTGLSVWQCGSGS